VLVSRADFGICICDVAIIVCLNLPNVFDRFTIRAKALDIVVKKSISLIMLIFVNLVIKLSNRVESSSAALANSSKP